MIPRRAFLASGPLALTACRATEGAYFGRTNPPGGQRLVAVLGVEPGSLDPATSAEPIEDGVVYALFEGLTTLHPRTGEPMAGLATHYELTPDGLRYTFFLRGHAAPRGRRLPDRGDLPFEYSRGLPPAYESLPLRWSDGVRLTAHDFVYSWRRTMDPATACDYANLFYCIVNAEAANSGRIPPDKLGVYAIGDLAVQVDLRAPTPYFLELVATKYLCPVPRHIIETAGKRWTEPEHIVTNGAFALRERRSGEKLLLTRNPFYYDTAAVGLEELVFLPILANAASANLYRTAEAVLTPVTPTLIPLLRRKKDYRPTPQFGVGWLSFRTTQQPFDDVRVRYALNMAIDKRAIADMRPGQKPAVTLVPPVKGYQPPAGVRARFGDSEIDVLAFNPRAAREMLQSAVGTSQLRIRHTHPPFAFMKMSALILQQQWRQTLGIELDLIELDAATWAQATFDKHYPGILANGDLGQYMDPSYFLEEFMSSGAGGSDWSDAKFDAMLAEAGAMTDRQRRLESLAQSEEYLLRAMPVVPLSTVVFPSLAKPFVKGLGANLLDRQQFKYVWIDTNWRPS